jgi:glycosyltransferase involved in cell wall biosynthesis
LRATLGLQPSTCYLIFVGNFLHRKGADILVETMARLQRYQNDIHLVVIGHHTFPNYPADQEYSDQLKQRIHDLGLEVKIHLVGLLDHSEYLRWLQACDIFFFPSRREGFPRVILEAMSVGLPCICSPISGIAEEMIEPEVSGIIIEGYDPEDYARQVFRLAGDMELRARLGSAARQRVIDNFDEEKAVIEYRRLYEEVLSKSRKQ